MGVDAGDFDGDGVTDVGVFWEGEWFIDVNGNGVWDQGDLWAKLGHDGDLPVTGDWDGDGVQTPAIIDPTGGLEGLGLTWYFRNSNSPGAPDIGPFPVN